MSCRVLISISFCSISVSLREDAITLPPRGAAGACLPDRALSHTFVSLCPQGPWAVPGGGAGGTFLIFMHKAPLSPFSPALPPFLWPCCSQRWLLHPWSAPGAERGRGWCWLWGAPHVGAAGCSASVPGTPHPLKGFSKVFSCCAYCCPAQAPLGWRGAAGPCTSGEHPQQLQHRHWLWPSAFSGGISQHGTPPRAALRRGGGKSLWEASGLCYEYIFTFCLAVRQPATCPQERCPGVKPSRRNSLAPRAAPLGMCCVKERLTGLGETAVSRKAR